MAPSHSESTEELQQKADELSRRLEQQARKHQQAVQALHSEIGELRARLGSLIAAKSAGKSQEALLSAAGSPEPKMPAKDDAFVRTFEWRIKDFAARCENMSKDEAMWSEEFSMMGVPGVKLEFFPKGRDSTHLPGFCALFLWCPAGVRVKYQLRVGTHRSAPDEDEFESRMGHGHSNFCYIEAQRDRETDSVLVGIDVLEIATFEEVAPGLRLVNQGPERLVARAAQILHNRHVDTVEWRIRNIRRRAELPRGVALCSPLFSIAGVRDMLLELYPRGIEQHSKENFCGFYVRCPSGNSLELTLFVGKARKGPIKTTFDGAASKGLPEFCRLEDQLEDGRDDLVVGVSVKNLRAEQEELRTTLVL